MSERKSIHVSRMYTTEQWEKIKEAALQKGHTTITSFISSEARKLTQRISCDPCVGIRAIKIRSKHRIDLPSDTVNKLVCMANAEGLQVGDFLSKHITDRILYGDDPTQPQ